MLCFKPALPVLLRPCRCSGARSRSPTRWWSRCKRRRVRFTQRSAGGPPLSPLSLALLRCRSHSPRRAPCVWRASVATARRIRRRCFCLVAPRTLAVKCALSCQPSPAHARSRTGPRRALLLTVPPRRAQNAKLLHSLAEAERHSALKSDELQLLQDGQSMLQQQLRVRAMTPRAASRTAWRPRAGACVASAARYRAWFCAFGGLTLCSAFPGRL